MSTNKNLTKKLAQAALLAALAYVGFQFFRIDIPVGTERTAFHFGNAFVVLAALLLFPFAQLIESSLKLPYLMPGAGTVLLLAAGTVLLSALVAALSSVVAAFRLSRIDPGIALREGN